MTYVRPSQSLIVATPNNTISESVMMAWLDWSLLLFLDSRGVAVSTGSACSSHKLEPSHVLLSLGLPHELCHGSLRITMGRSNTAEEVDYVADCIVEAVERFRGMSALGRL